MITLLRSASLIALLAAALSASAQFNSNLVANGDAESGTGSASGNDVLPVPGWTTVGNAIVVQYGAPNGGPGLTDPGPADRGANYFAGGPSNAASSLSQSIALAFGTSTIDAGRATYGLSAYLGGYSGQDDNAVLTATFLSASGTALGSGTVGPVYSADRGGATGLLFRSATGTVPAGARSVALVFSFTRLQGDYNDGYADDASLVLNAQPTPEPSALAALGLGAVAALRRRRRA